MSGDWIFVIQWVRLKASASVVRLRVKWSESECQCESQYSYGSIAHSVVGRALSPNDSASIEITDHWNHWNNITTTQLVSAQHCRRLIRPTASPTASPNVSQTASHSLFTRVHPLHSKTHSLTMPNTLTAVTRVEWLWPPAIGAMHSHRIGVSQPYYELNLRQQTDCKRLQKTTIDSIGPKSGPTVENRTEQHCICFALRTRASLHLWELCPLLWCSGWSL